MGTFLLYTSPARGHLYPMVPVLEELRRRGHSVAVRTLGSQVPVMRALGFDSEPIAAAIEEIEHDDWKARSPFAANRRVLKVYAARARHEIDDFQAALDDVSPDAVIVDFATMGAAAVAEGGPRPWAQFTPFFVPLQSPGVPPFGLGLRPRADLLGRIRDRLVDRLLLQPLLTAELDRLNAVRSAAGVPAFSRLTDQWTTAPLHLYFTAEPFEYPRANWPDSFRLVGPGTWEPPDDAPSWLEEIDGPLVVVSTSSEFQDDGKLVQTALDALAGEALTVVATTPSADPSTFAVPANARVERFVPHRPLLARAACVVCHGGMGITQKALAAGVPVCVVPFGRDQLEVAGHVVAAGAGTRVAAPLLSARRLRRAVLTAMDRRPAAVRLAEAFAELDGPVRAAEALEGLLADGRPRERPAEAIQPE